MTLVTCAACERHIRRTEKLCPFCGVVIASHVAIARERPLPTVRLGRAALLAFAATYVGTGCGGTTVDAGRIGEDGSGGAANGGTVAMGTGGQQLGSGGSSAAPMYGIAPFGGYAPSYGAAPSGGFPGSGGTTFAPPYGIAPFGGFPQSGGTTSTGGASAAGAGGTGGGGGSGQAGVAGATDATDGGARDGGADAEADTR